MTHGQGEYNWNSRYILGPNDRFTLVNRDMTIEHLCTDLFHQSIKRTNRVIFDELDYRYKYKLPMAVCGVYVIRLCGLFPCMINDWSEIW